MIGSLNTRWDMDVLEKCSSIQIDQVTGFMRFRFLRTQGSRYVHHFLSMIQNIIVITHTRSITEFERVLLHIWRCNDRVVLPTSKYEVHLPLKLVYSLTRKNQVQEVTILEKYLDLWRKPKSHLHLCLLPKEVTEWQLNSSLETL